MNRIIAFFAVVFFSLGVGLASAQESMPWEKDQKPLIKSKNSPSGEEKKKKAAKKKTKKKKAKQSDK